ncbi:MAG: di-heme enzyme [Burkholderiaceae bacterium]|nr:di-heme enzyme [Burkholderiaceae bacterium]
MLIAGLAASALVMSLVACGGGGTSVVDSAAPTPAQHPGTPAAWTWKLPSGFPVPKVPEGNPMSEAKVDLGRYLFYDRRLSGNGTQACASCHHQDKAFTDGRALALGSTGQLHPRGAQSLANAVYNATLTWANPSLVTLEKQMEVPLFSEDPVEMGIHDGNQAEVLARLAADPLYGPKFAAAFPGQAQPIAWGSVIQAISAFQRTLISGHSRYDQYTQGKTPLTPAEERGMRLFFGEKAECFHCHGSFNFNDQVVHASSRIVETPFHNTGLYNLGGSGNFPPGNQGLFEFTAQATDRGLFRAPSLRNVEVTAPYMHDGSIATLEGVLDFYAAGGRSLPSGPYAGDGRQHPNKSDLITLIRLDAQEKADLVAFLKTLTDHDFLTHPQFANPFPATR